MTAKKQGDVFWADPQGMVRHTFAEAFPNLTEVNVEIEETGPGNEGLGLRAFEKRQIREFINCSNPVCSGKAFSLADLLRAMSTKGTTAQTFERLCQGHTEDGASCHNDFIVKIRLTYREQPLPDETNQPQGSPQT